jgi:holo-[acyl-carrier protein] synthase
MSTAPQHNRQSILHAQALQRLGPDGALCVGVDSVLVAEIETSLQTFGERYLKRIFAAEEVAYAVSAPGSMAQRLAARFAAKEATIKALNLSHEGIGFHDIAVHRRPDGAPELVLSGAAAEALARWLGSGRCSMALSLCHDDHSASAVVGFLRHPPAVPPGTAVFTSQHDPRSRPHGLEP